MIKKKSTKKTIKKPWDIVICDEAHKLKNPNTKKSKCLKVIK